MRGKDNTSELVTMVKITPRALVTLLKMTPWYSS